MSKIRLTARQTEIFQHLRAGRTLSEITKLTGLLSSTVDTHILRARLRWGYRTREALLTDWIAGLDETQATVSTWSDAALGDDQDVFLVALRALGEMVGLIQLMAGNVLYLKAPHRALVDGLILDLQRASDALQLKTAVRLKTMQLDRTGAALQAAEVSITLDTLMTRIGISMRRARNQKMAFNRAEDRNVAIGQPTD